MEYVDVAGAVRDIFTAIYPDLGDMQAENIRRVIKKSFDEAGWSSDGDASAPEFSRFVEILNACGKSNRGLYSLLARLNKLDDYGFFNTDDESRCSLWEDEKPIIIRIHTTQNDNLQRAFAYLVFYGLYRDMFRRGMRDRITHALVFDEAHRTPLDLDSFQQWLRSAGNTEYLWYWHPMKRGTSMCLYFPLE